MVGSADPCSIVGEGRRRIPHPGHSPHPRNGVAYAGPQLTSPRRKPITAAEFDRPLGFVAGFALQDQQGAQLRKELIAALHQRQAIALLQLFGHKQEAGPMALHKGQRFRFCSDGPHQTLGKGRRTYEQRYRTPAAHAGHRAGALPQRLNLGPALDQCRDVGGEVHPKSLTSRVLRGHLACCQP